MVKKKVLILSLGTGKPNITIDNIEALEQTSQSDISPYTITNYRFNEDTEDVEKAAFLAIPLIKRFEPEEVVVLGTVQSAWAELAYKITTGIFGENTYRSLRVEFEKLVLTRPKSGKDTEDHVRHELERTINGLFEKIISVSSDTDIKRITAICTKYGISKDELDINYNELREHFEKIFTDKSVLHKVGFDITHSFRSLPIFNLVLLNYFRNIKDIEIDISNIYYGCFEASRECGYAPVVDLNELIYSMDLTTGVKEFLDTGNTVSLIDAINKNEENENEKNIISEDLRNINASFQFNRPDLLVKSLKKLKVTATSNNSGKTGEVKNIIKETLEEKLGSLFESENSNELLFAPNVQLEVAEWFVSKQVYGIASVCAGEALRGYTTVLYDKYVKNENDKKILQDIYDENIRRNSLADFFKRISYLWWGEEGDIEKLPKDDNSICRSFINESLSRSFKKPEHISENDKKMIRLVQIYNDDLQYMRNDFAHALWGDSEVSFDEKTTKLEDFINSLKEMAQLIIPGVEKENSYFETLYNKYDNSIDQQSNENKGDKKYYVLVSKDNYSYGREDELINYKRIQPIYDSNLIPEAHRNDKTKISEARVKCLINALDKIKGYEKKEIVICFNMNSLVDFDLMYFATGLRKSGYSQLSYYYNEGKELKSLPNLNKE